MIFSILFAIFGAIILSALPPFQGPDENVHWTLAVTRLESALTGETEVCSPALRLPEALGALDVRWVTGRSMPTGRLRGLETLEQLCIPEPAMYGSLATYPAVALARIFSPNHAYSGVASYLFYVLSRIISGLILLLFTWRFLRVAWAQGLLAAPGSMTVAALAMSPIFLQQSFVVTADTSVNATALALATCLVSWRRLVWTDVALAAVAGAAAAASKPVVAPLFVALPLLLVALRGLESGTWRVGSALDRRTRVLCGVMLALCVVAVVARLGASTSLHRIGQYTMALRPDYQIDPARQLQLVLASPLESLALFWQATRRVLVLAEWLPPLGWLDAPLDTRLISLWRSLAYAAMAVDAALVLRLLARARSRITVRVALVSGAYGVLTLGAAVAVAFASVLFLYLTFTTVGARFVDGVQQRYFFPSAIFALAALGPLRDAVVTGDAARPVPAWLRVSATVAIFALAVAYAMALFLTLGRRYW